MRTLAFILSFQFLLHVAIGQTQESHQESNQSNFISGQQLFESNCSQCHTTDANKLIGPGLKDVSNRYSRDWLHKWIRSAVTLIREGDSLANKIYMDYNLIVQPDFDLSEQQIDNILLFISLKNNE